MLAVHGDDIARWAQERMPGRVGFDAPFSVGFIENNQLIGAVIYDNYRPTVRSIGISVAIDNKKMLSKGVLKGIFSYPFVQLGCNRIQALIDADNHDSIDLCKRLGFEQEGRLRQGSPIVGNDLLIFGMLKEECKWLGS